MTRRAPGYVSVYSDNLPHLQEAAEMAHYYTLPVTPPTIYGSGVYGFLIPTPGGGGSNALLLREWDLATRNLAVTWFAMELGPEPTIKHTHR